MPQAERICYNCKSLFSFKRTSNLPQASNLVTSRPLAQLRLSTLQTRTALPPPSVVGPELFTLFHLCSSSSYMNTSQPRPDPIEINSPDELRPMATLNP